MYLDLQIKFLILILIYTFFDVCNVKQDKKIQLT